MIAPRPPRAVPPAAPRPRRRVVPCVALLSVLAATACDSPTAAPPRFDLVDPWVGSFQGERVGFPLRIRVERQDGVRVQGSADVVERRYALEGRYEPPTVYLRLTSAVDTLTFAGEMFASNFISGILLVESAAGPDQGRLALTRR